MAKKKTDVQKDEDLISELISSLNSEGKIAYSLQDDEINPSSIENWVSTGSPVLNIIFSNKIDGGYPCGRIIEVAGLESCVTEDTIVDIIIE